MCSSDLLESFDDEILKALKQGRKIAVVVNTVDSAQEVFLRWKSILKEKLPCKTVLCYHSCFIMQDRDEKEKLLLQKDGEGRPAGVDLVIATQAIEVSRGRPSASCWRAPPRIRAWPCR